MLTYAECCHAHFSVTRTSGTATTAHRHSHSEIASKDAEWMHSQCGTKAVALMFVCWNCFKKPLDNELKTTAVPKQRPSTSGVNCCCKMCMWFKMKHGKTTCDAKRPKDLEEYGFEVPERLRESLALVALPQMQLLALAHPPEEEFVDPTD